MNKTILLVLLVQISASLAVFQAKNGQLIGSNGKPCLIRGVNNAHADWDNYDRHYALKAIPVIAKHGVNSIRIQWRMKESSGKLKINNLENIIQTCINNKLVPIIELHDATGSNDAGALMNCANWYVQNKNTLLKFKDHLIVNLANEWSEFGTSAEKWRDSYIPAIKKFRESGFTGPLIIDAPAYAQDPNAPYKYGKKLVEQDPAHNLIFSLHMYAQWRKSGGDYNIGDWLAKLKATGITPLVGEFAHKHPHGSNNVWGDIDAYEIMRQCKAKSIGYIGWSWHGNGNGLDQINMVKGNPSDANSWVQSNFNEWGNIFFNYAGFSPKDTAGKCF